MKTLAVIWVMMVMNTILLYLAMVATDPPTRFWLIFIAVVWSTVTSAEMSILISGNSKGD